MFTGLVEGKGTIKGVTKKDGALVLEIICPFAIADVAIGESIAVDGACLTVESKNNAAFYAFVSAETLSKTTLAALKVGDVVNLERALRLGERLGGHLVTGHIDAIGMVVGAGKSGGSFRLDIGMDREFSRYLVVKGSIALVGVSLTINQCNGGEGTFSVNIIPLTMQTTTLGDKRLGSAINIEFDIIGKYVESLLDARLASDKKKIDTGFLAKHGFA